MPQKFTMIHDAALAKWAANEDHPAAYRALFLALTRAAANGHAEFGHGELAKLLGKGRRPHASASSVVARAAEAGLLDESSTVRCLVLPRDVLRLRPGTPKLPCPTHSGTPRSGKFASCHPSRPNKGHGRCEACYAAERRRAKALGRPAEWEVA